jgi:ABC-type lipoprotein export system ATPase subunit
VLTITNLEKFYEGPHGSLPVLRGVSLNVNQGELLFILGRSGSGKSTLLHLIGGLDYPNSGTIKFNGKNVNSMNDGSMAVYRNEKIGFVFQFFHLLPELTVEENVLLPSRIRGKLNSSRAETLLKRVDLWERKDHLPSELSGGEKQRTAIARALINKPSLVLCDEPTGNLDDETARLIHELIVELNREGQAFLIVTHDEQMAQSGHRIYRLHEGMVQLDSTTHREVLPAQNMRSNHGARESA